MINIIFALILTIIGTSLFVVAWHQAFSDYPYLSDNSILVLIASGFTCYIGGVLIGVCL